MSYREVPASGPLAELTIPGIEQMAGIEKAEIAYSV